MTELSPLLKLVHQLSGRDITVYESTFLMRSLAKRLYERSIHDLNAYCNLLVEEEAEVSELISSLNIDYSEFFRNPVTFAVLEQMVLPGLLKQRNKRNNLNIRIWSAGCSAGQEAYSMAMVMEESIKLIHPSASFQVFATDVSEKSVSRGKKGIYDSSALQKVPLRYLTTYFTVKNDQYMVIPQLKAKVEFSSYDLLDPDVKSPPAGIFGDFDIILCSNLLFYYTPEIRSQILKRLEQSLSGKGFLITGEAERDIVATSEFIAMDYPSHIFRKKPGSTKKKQG